MKDHHKSAYAIKRAAAKAKTGRPRRRAATKLGLSRLAIKPYSFTYNLPPQVLRFSGPGAMSLAPLPSGQYPLLAGGGTTWQTTSASNGLVDFYDIVGAVPFKLSDLTFYSSYNTLFDAYKIGKVGLHLEYLNNVSPVNQGGLMPTCYLFWDQDDAVMPVSVLGMTSRAGVKIRQFGDKGKTTLKTKAIPVTSSVLGNVGGGTATAGIANKPLWINCTQPTIAHNALKFIITDVYMPATGVTTAFRFNWTYNIKFRGPLLAA